MKLLAVCVGQPKEVKYRDKTVMTGIFKEPVEGRVMLRQTNLDGDRQADLRYHGGGDKAVYAYPFEHYAYWQEKLGRSDFKYGQFGENLTTEGLLEEEVRIGEVLGIGGALLQVTQPRTPCFKLGLKMGQDTFPPLFLESGRSGFYLRVLREGEIGAGDPIEIVERPTDCLTVRELWHLMHYETENREGAKIALAMPALSQAWRETLEERVRK